MGLRRRRSPWNRAGLRGILLLPLPGGNRNRDRHKTRVQKKRPGPGLRGPFDPGMSGQGIIPELGRAHRDIRRACGKAGLSQGRRVYGVSCAAVWIKKKIIGAETAEEAVKTVEETDAGRINQAHEG